MAYDYHNLARLVGKPVAQLKSDYGSSTTHSSPAAGPDSGSPSEPLKLLTEEELAALPATVWLVKGLIPANSYGLLVGKHGSFKTFLAIDLAASLATGREWHGHAVTRSTVLYVTGEGRGGFPTRLAAWRLASGVERTGLLFYPSPLQLLTLGNADRLAGSLRPLIQLQDPALPVLVIFDTLHRCTAGGEENSADTVAAALRNIDVLRESLPSTSVTVLFTHHPSKAGESGRGSSAWEDDADFVLRAEREAKDMTVTLRNTKQRDGLEHEPLTFNLEPVDGSLAPVSLASEWKVADRRALTQGERKALQVLADFHPEALSWTRWQKVSGIPDASLGRYRKRLLELGFADVGNSGSRRAICATAAGMAKALSP